MKKQAQIIIGFVVVFIIALFSILNVDKVPLNLGVAKIEAPLIIVILVSAFLGALLIFINSFTTIRQKDKEMKQYKAEKEEEIKELQQLLEEKPQVNPVELPEEKLETHIEFAPSEEDAKDETKQ